MCKRSVEKCEPPPLSPALSMHGTRIITWCWSRPYLLLTFTALCWAGNSIVARAARDTVPPVALAFWRWALALLLLLPFAWRHLQRDWAVVRANLKWILVLGTLGIGTFNTLLYTGLQKTTAVNGLLLQTLQPALILVFSAAIFREPIRMRQVFGILLSVIGALLIVLRGDLSSLIVLAFNSGDMVICVAVVVWALYSTLLRKRPNVHPVSFLAVTFMVGISVIFPFYLAEIAGGQTIQIRHESGLAIGYVCLFPSLIAYLFFNRGVELLGSVSASLYLNIMPVIGSVLAVAVLSERFGWFHLAGMGLIGAGIASTARISHAAPSRHVHVDLRP